MLLWDEGVMLVRRFMLVLNLVKCYYKVAAMVQVGFSMFDQPLTK